jgi:hypothetical protein
MLQKIKNKLLILASTVMFALPLAVPVAVSASHGGGHIQDGVCKGANELKITSDVAGSCDALPANVDETSLNDLLRRGINIFSVIVGVIAVLMIVFAGLRYITSGGDQTKVKSAKDTLLYAIIGLVIVALAQLIVRFVLKNASEI